MTQEELKQLVKPVIEYLDTVPAGQVIPSSWQVPEGYDFEKVNVGDTTVEHLIPVKKNGKAVFHLHGGGYAISLLDVYRDIAVMYSELAGGAEVFSVNYRVAPTDRAPAALDDAVAAYKWVLEQGFKGEDIVFIGDSAGGNLVLTTTLYLKENKLPLPKGVIAISPWTCVNPTPVSREKNKENDIILGINGLQMMYYEVMNSRYYEKADKESPFASPMNGDFKGFPSLLIQVGSYEILLDDSLMVAKAAREAGVDVRQTTYEGMSHDFQLLIPGIEETNKAWDEIKVFIEKIFA